MIARAALVWFLLLAVAIANGALREAVISPRVGSNTGHIVSTFLLCAFILLLAGITVPWVGPATARDALLVGMIWVTFTLAFEFLAGHYLFGKSWSDLLADYNVTRGRIWPLVLVATLLAPWLAFRLSAAR